MMWRPPTSPSSFISSPKKRRDHSTGLPRRPPLTGTTTRPPCSGASAAIILSISCASIIGMSPSAISAPLAASGTAAIPAFTEPASPLAKSGLCAKVTSRPSSAFSTSAA